MFAVIDVGTNTLTFLIARIKKNTLDVVHDQAVITRLGQGLSEHHYLNAPAMTRTFGALKQFRKTCDEKGVKKIVAVGTAALRTAANAQVFLERAREECKVRIEVISGEKEAELTFYAAWKDFSGKKKKIIVVDIGGGSTEVITGPLDPKKTSPETLISLSMGSVKLTEQYVHTDPLSKEDFDRLKRVIQNDIRDELDDFYPAGFDTARHLLVATAGTATTLAAVDRQVKKYSSEKIHGKRLTIGNLAALIETFISKTIKERQKMVGMEPLRADVILAGGLLLYELMQYFRQPYALISDRGLRYGVFYKKFMK